MTKMFTIPTVSGTKTMQTWNVFTGCRHACSYCWARPLALGRLRGRQKYSQGFAPTFHPGELGKTFKPGQFIFVASMGDISFAEARDVYQVLQVIRRYPETMFLFCTKNPRCYLLWEDMRFPENLYLGATIETNRRYPDVSRTPTPFDRYLALGAVKHHTKFVSIEPLMEFDLDILIRWLREIRPEIVEVGADNHGHCLREPGPEKVRELLAELRNFVPTVVEKEGLSRLKGAKDVVA
jgi:DNA repair photolyase